MNQYFALFQLPEQFSVDQVKLEDNYRALAAQCHPDRFAAKSAFEQKQAMLMTATINEAYRILSHPLDRAAYLLQQKGIDADAPEHTRFPEEFLMQQMQWREDLAEAQQSGDVTALKNLADTIQLSLQQLLSQLNTAFVNNQLEPAAELVRQGRFLTKLQAEISHTLP